IAALEQDLRVLQQGDADVLGEVVGVVGRPHEVAEIALEHLQVGLQEQVRLVPPGLVRRSVHPTPCARLRGKCNGKSCEKEKAPAGPWRGRRGAEVVSAQLAAGALCFIACHCSSVIWISRALEPLCWPTMPIFAIASIIFVERLAPTEKARWMREVDPRPSRRTSSTASSKRSSSAVPSMSPTDLSSISSAWYSGLPCWRSHFTRPRISSSETNVHWPRTGSKASIIFTSMSPLPSSRSAPFLSMMMRDSIWLGTRNAI